MLLEFLRARHWTRGRRSRGPNKWLCAGVSGERLSLQKQQAQNAADRRRWSRGQGQSLLMSSMRPKQVGDGLPYHWGTFFMEKVDRVSGRRPGLSLSNRRLQDISALKRELIETHLTVEGCPRNVAHHRLLREHRVNLLNETAPRREGSDAVIKDLDAGGSGHVTKDAVSRVKQQLPSLSVVDVPPPENWAVLESYLELCLDGLHAKHQRWTWRCD